jgi:hypothetical protein
MANWNVAIIHAYQGARFDEGALDVDVVGWLPAYRELVLDVARSLWLSQNRQHQRLPKGFDERFQLRLSQLTRGSAVATLERNTANAEQLLLSNAIDVFGVAMTVVERTVQADGAGVQLR